jgi:hypothetical protein
MRIRVASRNFTTSAALATLFISQQWLWFVLAAKRSKFHNVFGCSLLAPRMGRSNRKIRPPSGEISQGII